MAGIIKKRLDLSRADTERFINYYQSYDCLWNVSSPQYSKRDHRQAAYQSIALLMENGMTAEQVPIKIAALRTYYGKELRKVEFSKRSGAGSGDVYSSTWEWFTLMDSFLRNQVQQKPTTTNLTTESTEQNSFRVAANDFEQENLALPGTSMTSQEDHSFEQESVEEQSVCAPPSSKKRKMTTEKLQTALYETLQSIGKKSAKPQSDTDILFGEQVGLELKRVANLRKRQELKLKIQELIIQYQFPEE